MDRKFFPVVQQPHCGLGRLIIDVSRSDTIRHAHPLGLLWTSDQFIVEVATYTIHSKYQRQTSMHSAGFEIQVTAIQWPQRYAFRPLSQWDRRSFTLTSRSHIRGRITFGLLIESCDAFNSCLILCGNLNIIIFGKVTQTNIDIFSFKFSK